MATHLIYNFIWKICQLIAWFIVFADNFQKNGFVALFTGMLVSLVFGFIFGLIVGTTEMPWGFGDWPTEEMKGRQVNNKTCAFHFHLFLLTFVAVETLDHCGWVSHGR